MSGPSASTGLPVDGGDLLETPMGTPIASGTGMLPPAPPPGIDPTTYIQQVAANVAGTVAHSIGQEAANYMRNIARDTVAQMQTMAGQTTQAAGQHAHQAAMHAVHTANAQREVMKELLRLYKPKPLNLTRKDNERVREFFSKLEEYFSMAQVLDDGIKVRMAAYAFEGDVGTWWRGRYAGRTLSYEEVKMLVHERWVDSNDAQRAREQLHTLKQTGPAEEMIARLDRVCMRIPDITDDEKCARLLHALKPAVYKEIILVMETLNSYERMTNKVIQVDNALYRCKQREQGSGSRDHGGAANMEVNAMGDRPRRPNGQYKGKGDGKSKGQGDGKREFGGKCYNCGERGHLARDCPKPKKESHGPNGRR